MIIIQLVDIGHSFFRLSNLVIMRFSAAIPLLLALCVSAWRVPSNPPSSVDLTIAASEYNAQLLAGKLPVKDVAQQAAISIFKAFPSRNVIVTSLPFEVSTVRRAFLTALACGTRGGLMGCFLDGAPGGDGRLDV